MNMSAPALQPSQPGSDNVKCGRAGIRLVINDIARLHRTHPHFSRSVPLGGLRSIRFKPCSRSSNKMCQR